MPRKIVKITLEQEQKKLLLSALWDAFGRKGFDTTSVVAQAADVPEFMAVINATVLDRRSKWKRSQTSIAVDVRSLRGVLTGLADEHFDTDCHGWWYLRPETLAAA